MPAPRHRPAGAPLSPVDRVAAWPHPRLALLLALLAGAVTVLAFGPRFWLWPAVGQPLAEMIEIQPEFHRAFHAVRQLADPWQRIEDPVNRVIEWRLFFPVIGHYLALPRGLYLALPHLGALLALAAAAWFTLRATRDASAALCSTVLVGTSSWFFVSTGWLAYFDAWLVLALLVASFSSGRWPLVVVGLITPWVDERFILALPLCLAVRSLAPDRGGRSALVRDALALAAGAAVYLSLRFGAELSGARATGRSYWQNRPILPAAFHILGFGLWNGLRFGWVALALALTTAGIWRGSHRTALLICAATVGLNLAVADDLSRSASVAVPVLVAAVNALWPAVSPARRRTLAALAAANLLLPAQHVIAAPGTSAAYHVVPILSFPAEIARSRQPPEFASAAAYNRRSLDHFQNRVFDRAHANVAIALRFDPHYPAAIANRAILLHVEGNTAEGRAELDRALGLAPRLYDARMQRAAFRQQAGDLPGALADVRQALRDMPADWPRRKDAENYERALAAQAGR